MKVYFFLYKFSLEKMQSMLKSPMLMLVIQNYLQANGYSRVKEHPNMAENFEAY